MHPFPRFGGVTFPLAVLSVPKISLLNIPVLLTATNARPFGIEHLIYEHLAGFQSYD